MSWVRDLEYIITVPYACPTCGHHVTAEIEFAKPLHLDHGVLCSRCLEPYPNTFAWAVREAIEKFWKTHGT